MKGHLQWDDGSLTGGGKYPDGRGVRSLFWTVESVVRRYGRSVQRSAPWLRTPLVVLWATYIWCYVSLSIRVRSWRGRHEARIQPFETVWVDTDYLVYMIQPNTFPESKYQLFHTVRDGDWDRNVVAFEDTDLFRAFRAHFVDGVPWEETEFFHHIVADLERGSVRWGCSTRAEFEERCERLDDLYESIATHGFKTQAELLEGHVDDPISHNRASKTARLVYDEMSVNVGRNGELLLGDGRDRLAIAKILGTDSVPVRIFVRHEQWQVLRNDIVRGRVDCTTLPEDLRTHPDLTSLYCD